MTLTLENEREGEIIFNCEVQSSKWTERVDKEDLLTRADGKTRGHEYRMRTTGCLNDVKKYCFSGRNTDTWSGPKRKRSEQDTNMISRFGWTKADAKTKGHELYSNSLYYNNMKTHPPAHPHPHTRDQ